MSAVRSIAVSYAAVVDITPETLYSPAHRISANIVKHLWENWGKDEGGLRNGEVDLYSINIPMIEQLLDEEGLQIEWTSMWRNSYGRLFKTLSRSQEALNEGSSKAGPDGPHADSSGGSKGATDVDANAINNLVFKFSSDLTNSLTPHPSSIPLGSDGLAFAKGAVSVTPLRASFAEPLARPEGDDGNLNRIWKMKF
ncbi:hypothetical protein FIBSPDRAFT_858152 [Athelia psychrophila]|uniref:Uncharacterized protein n=1 Tax=Athelia psychrophila TaxID=1759441 RepID=A0A166M3N6_9AGAM|nr:hypothetical protein FIBSPDRAFT_858152 [Fibularhizoctonia sp. CBS 109695]